jgi:hypothetical protein
MAGPVVRWSALGVRLIVGLDGSRPIAKAETAVRLQGSVLLTQA